MSTKPKGKTVAGPQVACPRCKRRQPHLGSHRIYWCEDCRVQFDDDPDEGGDYSSYNPAERIERRERRAEQRGK